MGQTVGSNMAAHKDAKQVGAITSTERSEMITVAVGVNAQGSIGKYFTMPNKYTRKSVQSRGNWSQDNLSDAIKNVDGNISVHRASIEFKIPRKTLERRIKTGNPIKGNTGSSCVFGKENENRLSRHILTMQNRGFPLTKDDLRRIAYHFVQQLGIKHKFNSEHEKAGYDWLTLFLSRHPEITIRKSEGVSIARTTAMNRKDIWMREHFIPRKPLGKVLLILDGHASHVNSVEMLEFAESNSITIATGIMPFNRDVIPDYAFCIEDISSTVNAHSPPLEQRRIAQQPTDDLEATTID
ncbi:hypothetical protein NQ318_023225 [Aromia moschata]|uniref:HTH CENPB-type domain-containing protein n=1 Tax=Aromia moschata TaxID=1265417 RepID=A0AAV8XN93_9CUCU|nr:hypothetical protein NQ318_023225 [Aromia moschata]